MPLVRMQRCMHLCLYESVKFIFKCACACLRLVSIIHLQPEMITAMGLMCMNTMHACTGGAAIDRVSGKRFPS